MAWCRSDYPRLDRAPEGSLAGHPDRVRTGALAVGGCLMSQSRSGFIVGQTARHCRQQNERVER